MTLTSIAVTQGCERESKGGRARAKMTQAMQNQVASSLDIFKLDHGRYPDHLEELMFRPSYVKPDSWPQGGYLREQPLDGWGNKLIYRRSNSPGKPFELKSLGADGREGGEGNDADISF